MGRKAKNTIKVLISMHPSLKEDVRAYARKKTEKELKKESKTKQNEQISN